MNIGIVGCGLIGNKRANFISKDDVIIATADLDINSSKSIPSHMSYQDYKSVTRSRATDVIIVATPNKFLAEVAIDALEHGKHVLIEKPAGINSNELWHISNAGFQSNKKIWVGYNHRWHPAMLSTRNILAENMLGDIMFCRGLYGHGGRKGMENEWRSEVGELVDQGSHLIDLAYNFFNKSEWCHVDGLTPSYYWKGYADDNAFMTLVNKNRQIAFLHASCTEWRNMFQFEIYGTLGKLRIDGLGGSYGIEKLTWYDMENQETFPKIQTWTYPEPDNSWELEWGAFKNIIKHDLNPTSSIEDAISVMEAIEKIKRANVDC